MDEKEKEERQKDFDNRVNGIHEKKEFELRHNLRPKNNKIGSWYPYSHKITSIFGLLFASLSVIMQSGVMSYLYFFGLVFILKDTFKSGFTVKGFKVSKIKVNPLIYYFAASSIIFVAAFLNNMVIPGIEGGATYYVIQWLT